MNKFFIVVGSGLIGLCGFIALAITASSLWDEYQGTVIDLMQDQRYVRVILRSGELITYTDDACIMQITSDGEEVINALGYGRGKASPPIEHKKFYEGSTEGSLSVDGHHVGYTRCGISYELVHPVRLEASLGIYQITKAQFTVQQAAEWNQAINRFNKKNN